MGEAVWSRQVRARGRPRIQSRRGHLLCERSQASVSPGLSFLMCGAGEAEQMVSALSKLSPFEDSLHF